MSPYLRALWAPVASLRSNVLVSTAAMVLVGSIRPAFHAVVNRVFGAEVNGHAATLVAIIFLASLPATAALPTVAVRHVSRALGADDRPRVAGFFRLAAKAAVGLCLLGIAGALLHLKGAPRADLLLVAGGIAGYCYWRLFRTLLLAVGMATRSLVAEAAMFIAVVVTLVIIIERSLPAYALGALVAGYTVFLLMTVRLLIPLFRDARLESSDRRSFVRFNVLWFIGTASSLAARELALLFLGEESGQAAVGEVSVALSLLMLLALAPRIIEVPLVHELSQLGGKNDAGRQRTVTNRALHWLTIFTIALGGGAALLAGPILAIVGNVHTPAVILSFVIIAFAFSAEMVLTPATNLIIAESNPVVLTLIGAGSLVAAVAWWLSPLGTGMLGVVEGLALSYLVKAIALGWHGRVRFGIHLFERLVFKALALGVGGVLLFAVFRGVVSPWLGFLLFEALVILLFVRDIRNAAQTFFAEGAAG